MDDGALIMLELLPQAFPVYWGLVVIAVSVVISVNLGDNVPSEKAMKFERSFH